MRSERLRIRSDGAAPVALDADRAHAARGGRDLHPPPAASVERGLPVPIQYQFLEPEFCRVNYNLTFNGERVYAGIGFSAIAKHTVESAGNLLK